MVRESGTKDNRNCLKQVSTGFGGYVERMARNYRESGWDLGGAYRLDQTGVNFVNNPADRNCRSNSGGS